MTISTSRVAIYARCSDAKQAERDLSIPAQIDEARRWASSNRCEVVHEYIEPGESARTDDRPAFQQMIEDAGRKPRPFDVVLVWKFNRFARSRKDSVGYKYKLRRRGVRVVSINEPISDDPVGRMVEGVLESLDEFYSDNLAEDVMRGMRKNAEMGFFNGGVPPVGYRVRHTEGARSGRGVLEPDPEYGPIVKRIFASCLAGEGSKNVASSLNEDGFSTPRGKPWRTQGVLNVLRNEVYTGTRVWGKEAKARYSGEPPEPVRVAGAHAPLVSVEDFQRAQAMVAARSRRRVHPRRLGRRYLLSGLLVCSACGKAYIGHAAKSGKVHYYGCGTKIRSGAAACSGKLLNVKRAEATVADELRRLVLTPEHVAELVEMVNEELANRGEAADEELGPLDAQYADARRRLERLYDAVETGKVDMDDLGPRIRHWRARTDEITARRAALREQSSAPRALGIDAETIAAYVEGMRDLLARGSLDQRRAFLRAWIKRIDVDGPKLTIHYTFPHMPGGPGGDLLGTGGDEGAGGPGSGGAWSARATRASAGVLSLVKNGEPAGTRTRDQRIKSPLLYQLSYRPTREFYCCANSLRTEV